MSHLFQPPDFIPPASLTKQVGGTATGSITDVQTFNDGNTYDVDETTGVPGFEIDFDFTNVARLYGVVCHINYNGSASHDVTLRIRDYTAGADVELLLIPSSTHLGYRTVLLPSDTDFIDGSGNAQFILYHNSSGNASHDVFIDYIALLGVSL